MASMSIDRRSPKYRRRMTQAELLEIVEESARGGSWNAAAWLLERRWPKRWARMASHVKPPAEQKSDGDQDPFAQVVELARKRPR